MAPIGSRRSAPGRWKRAKRAATNASRRPRRRWRSPCRPASRAKASSGSLVCGNATNPPSRVAARRLRSIRRTRLERLQARDRVDDLQFERRRVDLGAGGRIEHRGTGTGASLRAMNAIAQERPGSRLRARLDDPRPLLADGAIGTNLFAVGLQTGDAPELWNVDHPERVRALHASFVEAGSDLVLTNTFGGTKYRLALHDAGHRVRELNVAGAALARRAADAAGREVYVAGSMGPTGEILEPNGALSVDAARAAFREQAEALAEGGVDVLWIETISSAEEIAAALLGAQDVGLPVALTVSIDTNGRTMMGLTAADVLAACARAGVTPVAVGTNCGVGASEVVAAIVNYDTARTVAAAPELADVPLVAKANCGIPQWVDGAIRYDGTPALMADYATLAIDAGARIVGGCCGTTPAHVAAMRIALDGHERGPAPDVATIVARLGEISQGARAQLDGDLSVQGGSASGRGSRTSRRRRG